MVNSKLKGLGTALKLLFASSPSKLNINNFRRTELIVRKCIYIFSLGLSKLDA
jgi:hypothetical protein